MIHEDQVFITNLTWEMVATNVISRPTSAITKFNAIVKFASIESFMRGIILFQWPWRCTVHLTVIWIVSSENVFVCSMINNHKLIYPCLFAFSFSNNALQHALSSNTTRKIALARNTCSKPPIFIKSCNLHVGNIRGAVGEIASYHKKD